MRMAELASRSGVARETIHFYLREGLLPRPAKGGRTVAYYGEEHLERLKLIRHLREDKYLPIAVIRRLLESPAAERDLDVLADVLHIIPAGDEPVRPPSAEARAIASSHGLLGPERTAAPLSTGSPAAGATGAAEPIDPAERRVLAAVEQALALDEDARRLTVADLEACATALTALVGREAELFFDAIFTSGDVGGSIRALRSGRGTVARFIAAYRDLMLRRIVEEVLLGLERGPELVVRTATVPLSARREEELGVPARRAALKDAFARAPSEENAAALCWHLFETGAAAELAALSEAALSPRLRVLAAWGALATTRNETTIAALGRAVSAAPDFALGQILLGEAVVARGLRRKLGGASLLEAGIPALNQVFSADPDRDPEAAARAFGWFLRGRLELSLPPVLGRRARGLGSLARALKIIEEEADRLEPAARILVGANARLSLSRHHAATGDAASARALLEAAAAMDPAGPIADVARAEIAAAGPG
ncbi:putative transcriptional regulator, MerR family protein [Minicystis rosea]|nr:putative transcriptional regulator, MerR family protein [Minicystis rosea]